MKKKIEEKTFFMEGTLRICGTLDIEKALGGLFRIYSKLHPGRRNLPPIFSG